MRTNFLPSALLTAMILSVGGPMACAQEPQPTPSRFQITSTDLAVTYTTLRSTVTPSGNEFWLKGGSIDAAATFRHFGIALNLSGDFASSIAPGVNLDELSAMIGPRYTRRVHTKHESRFFIEVLGGGVRGFDSAFPKSTGFVTRAASFTYQAGGGWDVQLTKHIAIRAIEADYVRSYLPNNGNDTQSHLRLAFGVCYHSGKP